MGLQLKRGKTLRRDYFFYVFKLRLSPLPRLITLKNDQDPKYAKPDHPGNHLICDICILFRYKGYVFFYIQSLWESRIFPLNYDMRMVAWWSWFITHDITMGEGHFSTYFCNKMCDHMAMQWMGIGYWLWPTQRTDIAWAFLVFEGFPEKDIHFVTCIDNLTLQGIILGFLNI